VEIAPDEPSLWRARGELEARLGRPEDARGSMRRALALSPQDSTLRQHVEALEPPVPRPDEALAEASEVFLRRRVGNVAQAGGYKLRSLQELTVRTMYPNGLAGTFRQAVFQVITAEGAEAVRSFPMHYEPDTQRFELRGARVFHPDGTVDESASLEEFALTGGASRMYYDSRAMVVSFPRLSPGDVVEVRWRVDDVAQRNAFADYFGDLYLLQSEVPRAQVRYVLRAPTSRQLYFHVPTLSRLERSEREEEGNRVYDFRATDVAAVPPEEHAPGLTERAAYLHVSTYRTWQDVGRWYWGLIADQLQADDRVRTIVREITQGLTTPRDRVRAVYDWVIRNTRYVALEFGIHGFLPYRVPDVCARGFGDCKDKASTIVAMLREVGIDASIVLVRTRNNGAIETAPASLAVFDHAIAYVPPMEGYPDGLFLDGTAQSFGMDELPSGNQGAMALLVSQRGEGRLTQIPIHAAERNVATARSEIVLQPAGGASLHVVHSVRGPGAGAFRMALEAQATRAERLEQWLAPSYPGVRVTEVRASELNDVQRAAQIEYEATVPTLGTRQGSTLLLPLVPSPNLTREYASRSVRASDVIISGPLTVEERRTIRLPAGATVSALPPAAQIDTPFLRLQFEAERQGNTIVVNRVLTYKVDRVPVAQYAVFRDACQRIDDALGRRATIQLAGAP
jgi:transglutaminase-like putative cysteine protease